MDTNVASPRILIVDDMPVNIDLMKAVLSQKKYQVVAAKNGQTDWQKLGTFELKR